MKISKRLELMVTYLGVTHKRHRDKYTFICHTAARVRADEQGKTFNEVWGDGWQMNNWPEVQFLESLGMTTSGSAFKDLDRDYIPIPSRTQQTARFMWLQLAILIAKEQGL